MPRLTGSSRASWRFWTVCPPSTHRESTRPQENTQGKPGRNRFYHDYLTGKGALAEADWIWDELFAFLTVAKIPAVNLLLSTYWTMAAVRHGDYVAKVRIAPVAAFADSVVQRSMVPNSTPEVYRPAFGRRATG